MTMTKTRDGETLAGHMDDSEKLTNAANFNKYTDGQSIRFGQVALITREGC